MGISYEKTKIHWNYYLAIEKDFENISRYVEFTEENNDTFSIELARVIMSASQEVDVIMKLICELLGNKNVDNIDNYRVVIKEKLSSLINEEIFISRFGIKSNPWANWSNDDKNPLWWRANNKIKHQRSSYFEKANLKNSINALGALLIVNIYYYKLKKQKEIGQDVIFKKITDELNARDSFIKLKDEYYSEIMEFM